MSAREKFRIAAIVFLLPPIGSAALGQSRDACTQGIATVSAAIASRQTAAARMAYDAVVVRNCIGPEQAIVARRLALAHLDALDAAEAAGAAVPQRLDVVRRGLQIDADTWQLREAEGDLVQALSVGTGGPDFAAASLIYQIALNATNSLRQGQKPPAREDLERLFHKAEQTRLLAQQLVTPPQGRDGKPGGLAPENVRGLGITRVAQPIHFETDSDQFTPLGQEAAIQLLDLLRAEGMPAIRLIGHTDERGGDDYNDRLSLARARAVVRFLNANGFPPGRAVAEGRGKRELFRVEQVDGVSYSQEQRWQMDRRVELVR